MPNSKGYSRNITGSSTQDKSNKQQQNTVCVCNIYYGLRRNGKDAESLCARQQGITDWELSDIQQRSSGSNALVVYIEMSL